MSASAVRSLTAGHVHRYRVFLAAQRLRNAVAEQAAVSAAWARIDGTLRATPEAAQEDYTAMAERDRAAQAEWDAALAALCAEVDR